MQDTDPALIDLSPPDWRTMIIDVPRTVTEGLVLLARFAAEKALEPLPPPPSPGPGETNGTPVLIKPQVIPWPHIHRMFSLMIPWCQREGAAPWTKEADRFYPKIHAGHLRWAYDKLTAVVTDPAQAQLAAVLHRVPAVATKHASPVMVVWMHLISAALAHMAALPRPVIVQTPEGGKQLAVRMGNLFSAVTEAQVGQWEQERQAVGGLREMLLFEATVMAYEINEIPWKTAPVAPQNPPAAPAATA